MKTNITIKTKIEIKLPSIPNFIRYENKEGCIDIGDLTSEQLADIGDKWTAQLIRKASKRKREYIRKLNKSLIELD